MASPTVETILQQHDGDVVAAADACAALPKDERSALLQSWQHWPGMADQTKRGARRDFLRVFSISAERAAASAAAAPEPPASPLRQRMVMFAELDIPLDGQFGCASLSELEDLLGSATQHDLREAALRTRRGVSVPASALAKFFLDEASFEPLRKPSKERRPAVDNSKPGAAAPARDGPVFRNSPLKRNSKPQDTSSAFSTSSESDSPDSEDIADVRPSRLHFDDLPRAPNSAPPPAPAAAGAGSAPALTSASHVMQSCIQLSEPGASADAVLTLSIIEDSLRVPELQPGALQLFEALAQRSQGRTEPTKSSLSSGTFLASIHTPAKLTGSAWPMAAPSYTFARRKDISCAPLVTSLVESIVHTSATTVTITLRTAPCAALATSSGVFGWAELWCGGGARLTRELWEPLRVMKMPPGSPNSDASRVLAGALGLTLSNITQAVPFCDDEGTQRLLSVALMTVASVRALQEAMLDAPTCACILLDNWLTFLNTQAILPTWIAQEQTTKAVLQARQPPPTERTGQRSVSARQSRQYKTSPAADFTQDDPAKFKWCSNCHSPSHSLLDCFSVTERFKNAIARGQDPDRFRSKLLQDLKAKWTKKGAAFMDHYRVSPPCTIEQLRAKLPA